jgi:hypothetical protein
LEGDHSVLKKAALVAGVAAAIVGISVPAFASDGAKTDLVPPVVGGVLGVVPWQPCAGNQATGVGGNLAASSPADFAGGCVNASVGGSGGLVNLAPWQPCAVNQFTGLGGNVALSSPGSFSGGCVNSSTGHGH